ncbi:MAG TPA: RES family NAD+ phosphorylase [Planctomycetota bacterium]|nr:RES family NAD+ phosphorylase [Planctomycetota bacterium]
MTEQLTQRIRKIAGRPETGLWLHLTSTDPVSGAAELIELMEHGGRLNPPRSFPVAYFSHDDETCRRELKRWMRYRSDFDNRYTILVAEMHLAKVLDLGDADIRRRLGISLAALADPADMSLSQSIGAAAHQAEFLGVLYPRPLGRGSLNLAAFCDRTSAAEISIVGAHPFS